MKTLNVIQTLAKIGWILSKIIFICCIVGFCFCLVGLLTVSVGTGSLKIGGVSVHSLVEENAGMDLHTTVAAMVVAQICCAAEAILSRFALLYFEHELAAGTPFTIQGAKELQKLGILTIAIPLGAVILCAIAVAVGKHVDPNLGEVSYGDYASVGLGLSMLVMSLLCRLGAEKADANKPQNVENN